MPAAANDNILEEIGFEIASVERIARLCVSSGESSERIVLFYGEVSVLDQQARRGPGLPRGRQLTRTPRVLKAQPCNGTSLIDGFRHLDREVPGLLHSPGSPLRRGAVTTLG